MLRIFTPVKIQRFRPGLNPQTWVPEASMLTTRPQKPSSMTCIISMEFWSCLTENTVCLQNKYHAVNIYREITDICFDAGSS